MAIIDDIKNREGETVYPRTLTKAIYEKGTHKKLDEVLNDNFREVDDKFLETEIAIEESKNIVDTVTGSKWRWGMENGIAFIEEVVE